MNEFHQYLLISHPLWQFKIIFTYTNYLSLAQLNFHFPIEIKRIFFIEFSFVFKNTFGHSAGGHVYPVTGFSKVKSVNHLSGMANFVSCSACENSDILCIIFDCNLSIVSPIFKVLNRTKRYFWSQIKIQQVFVL